MIKYSFFVPVFVMTKLLCGSGEAILVILISHYPGLYQKKVINFPRYVMIHVRHIDAKVDPVCPCQLIVYPCQLNWSRVKYRFIRAFS